MQYLAFLTSLKWSMQKLHVQYQMIQRGCLRMQPDVFLKQLTCAAGTTSTTTLKAFLDLPYINVILMWLGTGSDTGCGRKQTVFGDQNCPEVHFVFLSVAVVLFCFLNLNERVDWNTWKFQTLNKQSRWYQTCMKSSTVVLVWRENQSYTLCGKWTVPAISVCGYVAGTFSWCL